MNRSDFCAHAPEQGGVYALILYQPHGDLKVRIGALGEVVFAQGHYCYVGSARGGIRQRVTRHMRRTFERPHWHVDYLRRHTIPVGFLCWVGQRRGAECALSRRVAGVAQDLVPRFGSSDCACHTHLYYFQTDPLDVLEGIRLLGMRRVGSAVHE